MIYEQLGNYIRKSIEVSDEDLNTILSYFKPLKKVKMSYCWHRDKPASRLFLLEKAV